MSAHAQTQLVFTTNSSVAFPAMTFSAGSMVLVGYRFATTTGPFTCSDGVNSYTQIVSYTPTGDAAATVVFWYALNVAAGSTTITIGAGASVGVRGLASEFTGIATSSALDLNVAHLDSTASITTLTSNAGTPAQSAEMLMCYVHVSVNQASWTAGTLGSGTGTIPTNGTAGSRFTIEYHHETSIASDTGTFTWPTASTVTTTIMFSFKDAAAAADEELECSRQMRVTMAYLG